MQLLIAVENTHHGSIISTKTGKVLVTPLGDFFQNFNIKMSFKNHALAGGMVDNMKKPQLKTPHCYWNSTKSAPNDLSSGFQCLFIESTCKCDRELAVM